MPAIRRYLVTETHQTKVVANDSVEATNLAEKAFDGHYEGFRTIELTISEES